MPQVVHVIGSSLSHTHRGVTISKKLSATRLNSLDEVLHKSRLGATCSLSAVDGDVSDIWELSLCVKNIISTNSYCISIMLLTRAVSPDDEILDAGEVSLKIQRELRSSTVLIKTCHYGKVLLGYGWCAACTDKRICVWRVSQYHHFDLLLRELVESFALNLEVLSK